MWGSTTFPGGWFVDSSLYLASPEDGSETQWELLKLGGQIHLDLDLNSGSV